jgi:hypothetical protein
MHVLRLAASLQRVRPPEPGVVARARLVPWSDAGRLVRGVLARLAAPRLDERIAAGEDPWREAAMARRSSQLVSRRSRGQLARGLERAAAAKPEHLLVSAAVPVDQPAVALARPAMWQLASALRSRVGVNPCGVALTHVLLTEPGSALYCPAYPEELYEFAQAALLALGSGL